MDFVDWCHEVLGGLAQLRQTIPNADLCGVSEPDIVRVVYGPRVAGQPGYLDSSRRRGLLDALEELARLNWVERRLEGWWRITSVGEQAARDPTPLWRAVAAHYEQFASEFTSEEARLLHVVNQLSPRPAVDHARLEPVSADAVAREPEWAGGPATVWPVAKNLCRRHPEILRAAQWAGAGLDDVYPTAYYATYLGLVWHEAGHNRARGTA